MLTFLNGENHLCLQCVNYLAHQALSFMDGRWYHCGDTMLHCVGRKEPTSDKKQFSVGQIMPKR